MKKLLRITLWSATGLAVLVLLTGLVTLTAVNPIPALQPIPASSKELRATEAGPLRAGFGRVKLTPTVGASRDVPERGEFRYLPLAGFGNRKGKPAEGVHDDLWVRAMAFAVGGQTGVVVCADALIVPREIS